MTTPRKELAEPFGFVCISRSHSVMTTHWKELAGTYDSMCLFSISFAYVHILNIIEAKSK